MRSLILYRSRLIGVALLGDVTQKINYVISFDHLELLLQII